MPDGNTSSASRLSLSAMLPQAICGLSAVSREQTGASAGLVGKAQCSGRARDGRFGGADGQREVEGHHVVTKVDTLDNVADLLTKALDPVPFDKLRRMLLNILAVGAIYPVPRARRIAAKRATATRD